MLVDDGVAPAKYDAINVNAEHTNLQTDSIFQHAATSQQPQPHMGNSLHDKAAGSVSRASSCLTLVTTTNSEVI